MEYLFSKITGKLLTAFQQTKTKIVYPEVTAIVLPSGNVVQLYSNTNQDEYLLQIETHIIYN